jgi:hypothetical protein
MLQMDPALSRILVQKSFSVIGKSQRNFSGFFRGIAMMAILLRGNTHRLRSTKRNMKNLKFYLSQ